MLYALHEWTTQKLIKDGEDGFMYVRSTSTS